MQKSIKGLQPKKQAHPRDQKSDAELAILFACLQEYLKAKQAKLEENPDNKKKNQFKTQVKKKICQKYLDILHAANFLTYTLNNVSAFVNNNKGNSIPPKFLQQNIQNPANSAFPLQNTYPPPPNPPGFSQNQAIPNYPQQVSNNSYYQQPQNDKDAHQLIQPTNNQIPMQPTNNQIPMQPPNNQIPMQPPNNQIPMQPPFQTNHINNQLPFQLPQPLQPPQPPNNQILQPPVNNQAADQLSPPAAPSVSNPPSAEAYEVKISSDIFSSQSSIPNRPSSSDFYIFSRPPSDSFEIPSFIGLQSSSDFITHSTQSQLATSVQVQGQTPNNQNSNTDPSPNLNTNSNPIDTSNNTNSNNNEDHENEKIITKSSDELPSLSLNLSAPSSSSQLFSISSVLQSSSIEQDPADRLFSQLPSIPKLEGDLNETTLNTFKADLYQCIQKLYKAIHDSGDRLKGDENFEKRVEFQHEIEKRFVQCTESLVKSIKSDKVYSRDPLCKTVNVTEPNRTTSVTTRLLNGESLYFDSGFAHASSSEGLLPIHLRSSVDVKFVRFDHTVPQSNAEKESGSTEKVQASTEKVQESTEKVQEVSEDKVKIESFLSERDVEKYDPKIRSIYSGHFDEESHISVQINDTEAATIISYSKSRVGCDDILVCECAYAHYRVDSHVLTLRNVSVDTGFYLPVTSMYFYRSDDTDKLFLCGDVRVKEFTIVGLSDDPSSQRELRIENTNTYYFGKQQYKTSAITVWDKELVLGCNDKIFFWNVADSSALKNKETIEEKVDTEMLQSSGLDVHKVDWRHGKSYKTNQTIDTGEDLKLVTSLAVVSIKGDTFLAVASSSYPVIHVYNKKRQIVARLVSHTMGVTSLKSFGSNRLFSASLDTITRLWDVEAGVPEILCNSKNHRLTALECGLFCGKLLLFTGADDKTIQCFGVSDSKPLFDMELNEKLVVRKIGFIAGTNKNVGDYAKLMVLSDYEEHNSLNNRKSINIQYFEFK